MQVINLEATISTPTLEASINVPSLNVEMRTLRLGGGGGGTTDYNDLTNKPKIEGVTLQGNVPISDLGLRTSDLINDSGFITTGDIPTKTSDLTNDSNFQDATQVANAITAAIPTNVSSFTNDAGYITNADIPTNVSAFTNDAGYLTSGDLPSFAVDSVNGQTGAVVLTGDDIEASPYFSLSGTVGSVLAGHGLQIHYLGQQMPTKTSDLTNDSGFMSSAEASTQITNEVSAFIPKLYVAGGSDYALATNMAQNIPLAYCVTQIQYKQADGTPTPSDPLPITYYTTCDIMIDGNVARQMVLGANAALGTADALSGEVTITHVVTSLSSSWYWVKGSTQPPTNNCFTTTNFPSALNSASVCSHLKQASNPYAINMGNNEFLLGNNNGTCFITYGDSNTTVADLRTWLSNNDVQIMIELPTPITLSLGSESMIIMPYGDYRWSSNTGPINIKYFKHGAEDMINGIKTVIDLYS